MYKFVTHDEYLENYKENYPFARVSPDKTEVVLSCRFGEGDKTKGQALKYIADNWPYYVELN